MLDQPKPLGGGFSGVLRPQQTSVSAGRARRPVRLAALRLRRFSSFVPSRERSLWSGSKPDCAVVWPARPRVRWFWLGLLLLLLGAQKVKGAVWHVATRHCGRRRVCDIGCVDACLLGIFRLRVYAKTGAVSALPLRPSVGYRATYHCCGLVWCLGWLTVVCFRKGAVWHLLLCVIVLFERKGGEGVLEPVTWHDPLLVVSARRCLSPCPNPSPALRASFGFEPISSVYLSIYVENYQNKLPPISALQSHWALRTLHAAMQPCSR
jgi:hypothetical protein